MQGQKIQFNTEEYVIAVGFNSFEYFFYIMLSSALGLNLIMCDPKMLNTLLDNYKFNYSAVLSTKLINTNAIPTFHLNITLDYEVDSKNIVFEKKQGKLIFFTSGTTSLPKLVVYEEDTLLKNAKKVGEYLGIHQDDTCLCFFPTHYMYGFSMLMSTILNSGKVILERPTITAQEIWNYLAKDEIRVLPIIRSIIEKLRPFIYSEKKYFPQLIILNASDRIYVEHVQDALQICPVFWNNFGQTESGPRIFANKLTETELSNIDCYSSNGVIALGKPIDESIQVTILKNDGTLCDTNEIGSLIYQSPYAMLGYLDQNGHLLEKESIQSGDLVYKNEKGFICWVGRENETIKIDGKYVNIGLLHKYFDKLKFVKNSYFSTSKTSEKLQAYFVLKTKRSYQAETIKNKILELYRLAFPIYPRLEKIHFLEDIPTTLTGKVKLTDLLHFAELNNQARVMVYETH